MVANFHRKISYFRQFIAAKHIGISDTGGMVIVQNAVYLKELHCNASIETRIKNDISISIHVNHCEYQIFHCLKITVGIGIDSFHETETRRAAT